MAITYTWLVDSLESAPSQDGLTDVVKTVHWRLNAVDGDHSASVYGSASMDAPSGDTFTAYADLTQDQVVEWVKAKVEVSELEANLAGQIDKLQNPDVVTKAAPWAAE